MKLAQLEKTIAIAEARTGRRIKASKQETADSLRGPTVTAVEKLSSEADDLRRKISESRSHEDRARVDATHLIGAHIRGKTASSAWKRIATLKAAQTTQQQQRASYEIALSQVEAELHAASAAEAATVRKAKIAEWHKAASRIETAGADLDRYLDGFNAAVEVIRKEVNNVIVDRGHGPSAETMDVLLRQVVLTRLSGFQFLRLGQPDKRTTGSEVGRGWADSVRGGCRLESGTAAINPARPKPKNGASIAKTPLKPSPILDIDPAEHLEGDDETFRVYDVNEANLALAAASVGPNGETTK